MVDWSAPLTPNGLQRMLDQTTKSSKWLHTFRDDNYSISQHSMQYGAESEQWQKEKVNMLFSQFMEVLQAHTHDSEVFDTIQDLIQICEGVLEEMHRDEVRGYSTKLTSWVADELNTWKLIHALYKDRNIAQADVSMCGDLAVLNFSEKEIIIQLYASNSTLREYQLIVDWLEACYFKRENVQAGHTNVRIVGWENTLFQLKHPSDTAFGNSTEIVKFLDPDAPVREKRPLHPLDEEDNARLSKCLFVEIRQGRIEEAMALCKQCGQTWRAAVLEGWRLHEDPNYDATNAHEKLPIDGNPRRDIWKKCAWLIADSKKFDEYSRAIAGAFCGHLESLKALPNNTWNDLLWSYLKVQIDIRVESEIRACCMRSYQPMPEAYWNNKMSIEQIFDELTVHKDAEVRDFAMSKVGSLQKYLILDKIPELLQHMRNWVEGDNCAGNTSPLTSHMLRFLAHIVLFMRQIGKLDKDETSERVIVAYIKCLIEQGDPQLVVFYTAALPDEMQVRLYSKFLEGINETALRSKALQEAMSAGLDVESITRRTVESIRNRLPTDEEQTEVKAVKAQVGAISALDKRKILALEWLTFYPVQSSELLWQTNALIRHFMAENKPECVRAAFDMVPASTLRHIINTYGSKENLPCREEFSVKEYLSYKIYLSATESFNEWSRLYRNQPKEPRPVKHDATFTERVAAERREQTYRAEVKRWNLNLEEQATVTRNALYHVLLFPENGWLIDPYPPKNPADNSEVCWKNRLIQMGKLRSICLPEVALLLHQVLHLSGDYKGCVKLAHVIASEKCHLYKIYTSHKLAELLSKIAASSLELLKRKQDPFGYKPTV